MSILAKHIPKFNSSQSLQGTATCTIESLAYRGKGRTGEYWPEVERSEFRAKTTESLYSPEQLEQAV